MAADGSLIWNSRGVRLQPAELNPFLLHCVQNGASDITFQSGEIVRVEVNGVLRYGTRKAFDSSDMQMVIDTITQDTSAKTQLAGGRYLDRSYEFSVGERGEDSYRQRFRVNIMPLWADGRHGQQVTMRVIERIAPEIESLGLEADLLPWLQPRNGMIWITGPTGAGKTTVKVAILRWRARGGCGKVITLEDPIEYTYDDIEVEGTLISQHEIGRDVVSFAEGLRSGLRRKPAGFDIGEARDAETLLAALEAARTGHWTMVTSHTSSVAETVDRAVVEFPAQEQEARAFDVIHTARCIVAQILVPNAKGGRRVGLREYLGFSEEIRRQILKKPRVEWSEEIEGLVREAGQSMSKAAFKAADRGLIDEQTYEWVVGRARAVSA